MGGAEELTHESKTDPQARLYRKSFGTESKLCYAGHILMDNRHGLAVDASLSLATGEAERAVALRMADRIGGARRVTLGAVGTPKGAGTASGGRARRARRETAMPPG